MSNRLANATSPYLRQHAHNPVDWYPWGAEALARAAREDKPILLSVGYSACHWCHVMERESFEDPVTAELMNRDFISVKVDREERPDLDEIYMRAVQAFTGGHGGWPMTVFLQPDGRPFFGGTYFPPEPSRGLPSFRNVLERAQQLYRNDRATLEKLSAQVLEVIEGGGRMPAPDAELTDRWLEPLFEAADEDFDERWAGFGGAPKFPPHGQLAALLAYAHQTGNKRAREMVAKTLDAMARGGMYDLLGGGFSRYSVDERWSVPHFEKMLYDNAQLVPIYLDAYALTKDESYAEIARETLAWVSREMTDAAGRFYSAQDADSEGVEGKFFAFAPKDVRDAVGEVEAKTVAALFSVTEEGSFEHGTSVLRLAAPRRGELSASARALFDEARKKLFTFREKRVRPGLDDKVITAWNAMMISAFARAAQVFGDRAYAEIAARAASSLLETMQKDGRLLRTNTIFAYLEDYVLFGEALLDLYETTFERRWLEQSVRLAHESVRLFWDEKEGGLFLTGHDAEPLVARTKAFIGSATPSGNGAAAMLYARLDAMGEEATLGEKADRILRSYSPLLSRAPRALGREAIAGAWRAGATQELGVVGDDPPFVEAVHRRYLPFKVFARIAPGDAVDLYPWMEQRTAIGGRTTGYACQNRACRAPANTIEDWERELDALEKPAARPPVSKGRVRAPDLPTDPELWLNTDRPLDLETLRGRVVVLDFFTYCCINCMHVLPELAAIEAQFANEPVVVIGVHSAKFSAEKERENVRRAIHRHRIEHPVVLDSEHNLWSEHAVNAWPTIVVLDPTGRVAWKKSGEVEREELGKVIDRLLEEGREEHTLGVRLAITADDRDRGSTLLFPGKVHVYPDAQHQSLGEDAFGANARLYIADTGHHRVLEAALSRDEEGWPRVSILRTFGSGQPDLRDGLPNDACFQGPQGVCRFEGTLFVADTENHALRGIELSSGNTKTLAGTGKKGSSGRGDPARPRELSLRSPWDVAALDGGVFVAMAGTHQIWAYLPDRQQMGPMIGTGREAHVDGPVGEAALAQPSGLSLFGHLLFFADSETSSIRIADLREHQVATVVGRGLFDFGDVDGAGEEVRLQHPLGVAAYEATVYVADTFNDKIKAIELDGAKTRTLAGGGVLREPGGISVAGDFLIVADTGNHRLVSVHRKTGEMRTIAL